MIWELLRVRLSEVFNGYQRFSMVIRGFQWLSDVFNGYQRFSMVINGYRSAPMLVAKGNVIITPDNH